MVLDTSIAIAWCIEDETSPVLDLLLEDVRDGGATVPQLWPLEIGNVLLKAVRRGRLTPADMAVRLELLQALPISIDDQTAALGLRDIVTLARAESLSTYDAAYLELSMRLGVPLATRDRQLRDAAARNGVQLLPERL
ncbi:MAG: type II toxin-antitoxin system VapC family toxin [Geminicoccaceae bacterium]